MSTLPLTPRLRVALIASSLRLGGAEKQFVYMARGLFAAGVDARVFYLGSGGYYEPVLRETGIPLRQIHTPGRPWLILARLIKALRIFRPHLVLTSQFDELVYGAIAGRLCQALVLGGVRSDGFYELKSRPHLSRWMLRLSDGLIANSVRAKENLLSCGVKPPRIEVLSNVIDLHDFDTRARMPSPISLPAGRVIAAAVGSLNPSKRLDRFLDALSTARRREPALFGLIAGADQGAKASLQQRANALGLTPHHLSFFNETDRVPALLSQAQVLVLCSDCEGFPNIILEAMAARLPVVTTPVGDAGLVVQDGITGYVVGAEDKQRMAECLVRLAQSPELRRQFGEAGRKRVEQEYQCESLSDRLLSLFREFASRPPRASLLMRLKPIEQLP